MFQFSAMLNLLILLFVSRIVYADVLVDALNSPNKRDTVAVAILDSLVGNMASAVQQDVENGNTNATECIIPCA
ncbi:hypothetical protein HK100_009018, partial [Physocladia obscura]